MKTQLFIDNIKCGGCVATIKNELLKLDGIVEVEIEGNTVSVSSESIDSLVIIQKLEAIGYPKVS